MPTDDWIYIRWVGGDHRRSATGGEGEEECRRQIFARHRVLNNSVALAAKISQAAAGILCLERVADNNCRQVVYCGICRGLQLIFDCRRILKVPKIWTAARAKIMRVPRMK